MGCPLHYDIITDANRKTIMAMSQWFQRKHNGWIKADILEQGKTEEPLTWYEFEQEMVELSQEFPTVLFTCKESEPNATYAEMTRLWIRNGEVIKHQPLVCWPEEPSPDKLAALGT